MPQSADPQRAPPILVGNTQGSVFAYNFGIGNTTFANNPGWQMPGAPPWEVAGRSSSR